MDTKWRPAMKSAISEVLETMFFESVELTPSDEGARSWYCESTIRFAGADRLMELSLCLAEPFARSIAANFVGSSEDSVSQDEMADVMRELANMVGGNYLGQLPEEDWQLEIPAFRLIEGPSGGASSGMSLMVMGECVGVVSLRSCS